MEYKYSDLTKNQQRLIDGLLSGLNHAEAYRKAYPKSKMTDAQMSTEVNKMINNEREKFPKFSQIFKKMKEKAGKQAEEGTIATATEVLQLYTKIMRDELQEETPMLTVTGKIKMVKKGVSIRDRKAAADSIAKHYGILTDKVSLDITPIVIKDDVPYE